MSNPVFEHHRQMIYGIRRALCAVQYREQMRAFAAGKYASEADALEGVEIEARVPLDAEVIESLQSNLEWARRMREAAKAHGDKWGLTVRAKWLREADRIEAHASLALAERETA